MTIWYWKNSTDEVLHPIQDLADIFFPNSVGFRIDFPTAAPQFGILLSRNAFEKL
jgi:hypothetical protein